MAVVSGVNAPRVLAIEAKTVIGGDVSNETLTLTRLDGTVITIPGVGGGGGGGGLTVTVSFATASTAWVINHNLGDMNPYVVARDTNGNEIEGDVIRVDANTTRIEWYFPVAGTATVSN